MRAPGAASASPAVAVARAPATGAAEPAISNDLRVTAMAIPHPRLTVVLCVAFLVQAHASDQNHSGTHRF
ncbi:hypothetical protein GCM10027168_61460 [Streptomyces capparidis]